MLACRIALLGFLCFTLSLGAFVQVAKAEGSITAASVTDEEKALLERIETHMREVKTSKARFIQVSSTGNYAEGTVFINRPWKMRIEYDPPTPVLIVSDGNFLIYHDKELDQFSHIPLGLTPAGILLKPDISFFSNEVQLESVKKADSTIEVAVRQADDPEAGLLTMVFSEAPLELRQWKILDPQAVETTVSLFDIETGLELDSDLFYLAVPAGQTRD